MITVYTDGASRGNPGPSGVGIYIKDDQKTYEYSIPLQQMTNHEAEFHAVIEALKICQQKFPNEILSFRSDAKIVVDSIEKNFTNNDAFQPLLEKVSKKSAIFPYFFIKWIPANTNIQADQLAKQAIRKKYKK